MLLAISTGPLLALVMLTGLIGPTALVGIVFSYLFDAKETFLTNSTADVSATLDTMALNIGLGILRLRLIIRLKTVFSSTPLIWVSNKLFIN